jgi:hypothetical protein
MGRSRTWRSIIGHSWIGLIKIGEPRIGRRYLFVYVNVRVCDWSVVVEVRVRI